MTSERETAEISIPTVVDHKGEATFIAKKFEDTYSVSLDGPVPIVLDLIVVTPAEEDTYCGVNTHILEHIIISPEVFYNSLHQHTRDFNQRLPE